MLDIPENELPCFRNRPQEKQHRLHSVRAYGLVTRWSTLGGWLSHR